MLNRSRTPTITRNSDAWTRLEFIRRQLKKDDISLSLSAIQKVINGDYSLMPVTITSRILKLATQEPFL
jgi:hypothetical protein